MNKKLFLKLGLLLLSVSLVACGQTNNSAAKNNSSNSSTTHLADNTKNSAKESVKTISPPAENEVKSKQQNNSVEKTIPQNNQEDIRSESPQDTQPAPQEYSTENGVFIVTSPNTVQDVCEFDLAGIYVTPKIEPLNNSGTYSHIDVKNKDNVYIDVIIDVKNLNNEAKLTGDLITAKIKIKSTEYTCFSVAENADNTDLEGNASINPLETREIHYVAEVPKTEATGEITLTLTINGKDFSNKFHLEGMMP
ncbi:hypothetical protein KPL39_05695 [Clostridium gasigenes]|uniref:hypothetical protein n=1 Tax=Clostridium gasigenes TaxID=94869 RepID=UPI001C0E3CFD|nr:hypothetical protein [Clostridium gasigenes]MBU3135757.1 hypothetical protein [Clostridium gasigenes]